MFLYDFRCTRCGDTREELVQPEDITLDCPTCGGNHTMKRVITSVNFRLPTNDPDFPGAWDKWGRDYTNRQREARRKAAEQAATE